jgi:hypothetical protein
VEQGDIESPAWTANWRQREVFEESKNTLREGWPLPPFFDVRFSYLFGNFRLLDQISQRGFSWRLPLRCSC